MALTKREFQILKRKCGKLENGPDYRGNDYVIDLFLTVLDFHMRVETVEKALKYFRKNHGYRSHRKLRSHLGQFSNTKKGNIKLANCLWNNDHWSRAKFLRMLIKELECRGVKGKKTLKKWVRSADFEKDIKGKFKIDNPKHSIGLTIFNWLRLRLGEPTVKADKHVRQFVSDTVGRNGWRSVSVTEATDSLCLVAEQLKREPALLDSAIWHYQRRDA